MKRYVRSKEYGMVGLAYEEQDGYTWVTFIRGRIGQWRPNEDLLDISEGSKPCDGKNSNVCVGEGCYGEACMSEEDQTVPKEVSDKVKDAVEKADDWDREAAAKDKKR